MREPSPIDRPAEAGASLSEEFVTQVAGVQRSLYAYVRSLVGPWAEPEDILQEVNLVLCRKAKEFDGRSRFLTWACGVAYFQVLAHLKQRRRQKCVYVDDTLLAELAGPLAERVEELDERLEALRHCVSLLAPIQRRMIAARYASGGSVRTVAESEGRPEGSVRVTLHRIRLALLGCVERTLKGEKRT